MQTQNPKNLPPFWRHLLGMALILLAAVALLRSPVLQVLQSGQTDRPIVAALVLLALYAAKSATVFFPLIVLEIAAGDLFSTPAALAVNFLGLWILLSIPYAMGRWTGRAAAEKILNRYPKFAALLEKRQGNAFFLCFFLRIISCLPGDLVSMYFGATEMSFWRHLLGGLLGLLPGMILATLIGAGIRNPQSPMFWISVVLKALLSIVSLLVYRLYRRKMNKKNDNHQKEG